MALGANLVWEARAATGSDANGGAWLAGAGTTDYSQQAAAQLSVADGVTVGTTTVSSATGGFTAAMVGNVINIVTDGRYQITAVGSTNSITVDRATGTATGLTLNVGGALATLNTLATAMIAGNKAFVTGAFTTTATITFAQTVTPGVTSRLQGYGSVRGDTGRATLTLQTNTGLTGINCTGNGWVVEQVDVDCANLGTSTGIVLATFSQVRNCKASNFKTRGIYGGTLGAVTDCEATGGGSAAPGIMGGASCNIYGCWSHDNQGVGIVGGPALNSGNGVSIDRCIVANNSGAASDGISASYQTSVINCTVHGNGRDGIFFGGGGFDPAMVIRNNILTSNGRYGLASSAANAASPVFDGNAYWNNTSGARNNVDAVTGNYGVNPYTNVRDVTLTGSPYTGPTSGGSENFGLNATAGAGAACRAVGTPGAFPGLATTVGYLDLGAAQAQAAAAASSGSHFIS